MELTFKGCFFIFQRGPIAYQVDVSNFLVACFEEVNSLLDLSFESSQWSFLKRLDGLEL
jgi:hypothetical protein